MKQISDIFVSAVLIQDKHSIDVPSRVRDLAVIMQENYSNYEIVVVDSGFPTPDVRELTRLLRTTPCIRVLQLASEYDVDTNVFAGLEAAIGDYVCILYNNDPIELITRFVKANKDNDIVFGVANNLQREGLVQQFGAKMFYRYSKQVLNIDIPEKSTYFMCLNRGAVNALTRGGRQMRHIRHMAHRVGFTSTVIRYDLPHEGLPYVHSSGRRQLNRAIELAVGYSNHPLRFLSYAGIVAGLMNILYAIYVVWINLTSHDIAKGWTTTSLQSSLMFFMLFIILAVLSEYIGKILNETQQEPAYHIARELSSTINIADETRRNIQR